MDRNQKKEGGKSDVTDTPQQFHKHLKPVLILTSIFFINFISRIIIAPFTTSIENDLGISHAASATFFLFISIGYFTTLIASGIVSSIISHRQTILASSFFLSIALFSTALMNGLQGIRIGLFFLGMATGLYLPSAVATLTGLIKPQHWGKAFAIHELAPNLSFIAAPLLAEFTLITYGRQAGFFILGCAGLILTILFYFFGSGGEFRGDYPNLAYIRTLLSSRSTWIMIILFSLGVGSVLGIYAMLPIFLVTERGMDRQWANTLLSVSRIFSLAMPFVAGWATDRFGPNRVLTLILLFAGILTILLASVPQPWIPLFVCLQSMVAVSFFVPGMAALSAMSKIETRSIAVSLTVSLGFLIGGGGVPFFIGLIGDMRSVAFGITLVGGIITMGAILPNHLKYLLKTK